MVELLILADDFTGALDTGVQFARQSIPTLVSTRIETLDQGMEEEISVLVLDLETRHLAPEEAAVRVRHAVQRARRIGIELFYKKTDSTLRGNIGSELGALLEAAGASMLAFVPAYPANGRTTVAGRQYLDGTPLHLTAYAEDPRDPVRSSYVPEIIAVQISTPVEVIENPDDVSRLQPGHATGRIVVFDARSDEDLQQIAERLKRLGLLRITAGCAGFAAHLPLVLALNRRAMQRSQCPSQLLVVCGSTNPVSLEQIETAVQRGMERIVLEPGQVLDQSGRKRESIAEGSLLTRIEAVLSGGRDLILQTARGEEDLRCVHDYARSIGFQAAAVPRLVAQGLTELVSRILRSRDKLTPVVFGGDTALELVERLGLPNVLPFEQISPGVVVSRVKSNSLDIPLISKAGGFGASGIIREIQRFVS